MNAAGLDGRIDRLRDDLARAGMGLMALDDNRAAGSKGRCRVTAGGREGQRKFEAPNTATRGPTDARSDGYPGAAAADGPAGRIVTAVEIVALFNVAGEKAQLAGRAAAFALKTGFRKARFG